jgi:hypothetical protein
MKRLAWIAVLAVGFSSLAAAAPSLVGSWTLVRVDNIAKDGSRTPLYGENPEGLLIFSADGRYALQIFRKDRAPFAASDKSKGTADEYKAAALGSNAHFGRFRIDGGKLVFHIERASFPNWDGTEQARGFTVQGDELIYTVPAPTSGSAVHGEVAWKRAGS